MRRGWGIKLPSGVVDIPEFNDPNDRSGIVPVDVDASGRELGAADIHCDFGRCG